MAQSRVVMIVGVSRHIGGLIAARMAEESALDRIIGVDTVPPPPDSLPDRIEFVRADIRNPLIAKVIASADVDTVLHMNLLATPRGAGGVSAMKEMNVIGTMQLLAACQKAPSMRRLVLRSTTAVYGASPRDPALFTEDIAPRRAPRRGFGKDAVEVEGYVRGFARRRPDVTTTVLRFANLLGPVVDTPLSRYFQLPALPTVFGFDPRLQLIHEDDAVELLRRVTLSDLPGVYNAGARGILLLSQAIRRAGKVSVPVPAPLMSTVSAVVRRMGLVDFSPDQLESFLIHGRVVDSSRLESALGWQPEFSTGETFDNFVSSHGITPAIPAELALRAEQAVSAALQSTRGAAGA